MVLLAKSKLLAAGIQPEDLWQLQSSQEKAPKKKGLLTREAEVAKKKKKGLLTREPEVAKKKKKKDYKTQES